MTKYINADRLKQMVEHKMDMQDTYLPAHFFDIVDDMPAADVQEVVRCKDCKYRKNEQPGMVYCPHMIAGWVDENWFCAGGQKE